VRKLLPYKGYTATVEFDSDEMVLHGRLTNIQDVVTFHAESVAQLPAAFEEAVDDYLELCRERGEEPDRPYSGRFVVRLDPQLHRRLAADAERRRISINTWIVETVERALDEKANGAIVYDRTSERLASATALYWRASANSSAYLVPDTPRIEPVAEAELRSQLGRLGRVAWSGRNHAQKPIRKVALQ
jgi:predicted HicB family RNase H-like nuclease